MTFSSRNTKLVGVVDFDKEFNVPKKLKRKKRERHFVSPDGDAILIVIDFFSKSFQFSFSNTL